MSLVEDMRKAYRRGLIVAAAAVFVVLSSGLAMQGLLPLACALVIISKWQVTIGGRKHLLTNLRNNAVDVIFSLSMLYLINDAVGSQAEQLAFVAIYLFWAFVIKPQSSQGWMGVQAWMALVVGVNSTMLELHSSSAEILVYPITAAIAYLSARHFMSDETNENRLIPLIWMTLVVQFVWVFWQWFVIFTLIDGAVKIAQAAVVIGILGYGLGNIYFDHAHESLSQRRLVFYILAIFTALMAVFMASTWNVVV